jgi:DNA-binding Lrp family transcriptional regulator
MSDALSVYFDLEVKPESFQEVVNLLNENPIVTQLYRTTGQCHLHVHVVTSSQDEMERFLRDVMDQLPGVISLTTQVILSRIKDIKGLRL